MRRLLRPAALAAILPCGLAVAADDDRRRAREGGARAREPVGGEQVEHRLEGRAVPVRAQELVRGAAWRRPEQHRPPGRVVLEQRAPHSRDQITPAPIGGTVGGRLVGAVGHHPPDDRSGSAQAEGRQRAAAVFDVDDLVHEQPAGGDLEAVAHRSLHRLPAQLEAVGEEHNVALSSPSSPSGKTAPVSGSITSG